MDGASDRPGMTKILAALAIGVGGIDTVLNLLGAFGVDLSDAQRGAIGATASLLLLVVGVWFHPSVPLGVKE